MTASGIISRLRDELDRTFTTLNAWLAEDVSVRKFRSRPDEWSIEEILEHVTLANHYLLILIEKARKKALKNPDPSRIKYELEGYRLTSPRLEEIGVNNSFPWNCPRHMMPTGKKTPDRMQAEMATQETRLRESLSMMQNGEGVLCRTAMSVHSLGRLDVYQYIYFLLMHAQRHIQQMEETAFGCNIIKRS
ncbi:MAG: hypothetical protein A2176_14805 [Spirochaetes bacterium RBG_13_51_14]|nr:MAG: hypothetical protein A2176_14805 [Spirochaetes bacterium RBG_13_51_14]